MTACIVSVPTFSSRAEFLGPGETFVLFRQGVPWLR